MFSRNSLLVSVAILICCLWMAVVPHLFGQGDQPQPFIGRYHATAAGDMGAVFVCDTLTGECWYGAVGVEWRSLGKPTDPKAEEAAAVIRRR